MAAILPAIHNPQGRTPGLVEVRSPVHKNGGSARIIQLGVVKKRSQGKKERELEQKKMILRAQQRDLDKVETAQYRNTFKHNLCLDMLEEGFHKSFAELFALVKQQNEERDQAGPESLLWNETLLENEPEKLQTLKAQLTQAELAERNGKMDEVYKCQHQLALYFQGSSDKWLADHFFRRCLETSAHMSKDGGFMAAQAHCNVGLALEESGNFFDAADNFSLYHKLTADNPDWTSESGVSLHTEACTNLCRIYTTIAQQYKTTGDLQSYLQYLVKAHSCAKESGDRQLEGDAGYRLGQAYEKNGDSKTALKLLHECLDTCQQLNDNSGYGKTCEAIAKSYESQGKVEESIKYLEMFVDIAERSKDDSALSRACSDLGAMFNSLGRYEQAVDYFNKSYNISRATNDADAISSSRVLFGVAAAHKMLEGVSSHTDMGSKPCMERLIEWKDSRVDNFDKPIPSEEEISPSPVSKSEPQEQSAEASATSVGEEDEQKETEKEEEEKENTEEGEQTEQTS